jgi:hypothetical protein
MILLGLTLLGLWWFNAPGWVYILVLAFTWAIDDD